MEICGLDGIFIKAKNPNQLYNWYEENLGLKKDDSGSFVLPTEKRFLPVDTSYFSPAKNPCLLNLQVENLAPVLSSLADNGVRIDDHLGESDLGRFAWVFDPEGNKIELWEPSPLSYNPIDFGEPE